MINVVTVHWQTPKWIDVQLGYLERNIRAPFRVYASVNGVDDALDDPRFHFAADLPGSHAEKLNELAGMVLERSEPTDVLMFVDGDAFPVQPLVPWVADVLADYPLAAVRRDENLGDPQPHPCFCVTTAAFWAEIGGDWRAGRPWVNDVGTTVADVGGALLERLQERGTAWLPLLRTNTHNPHPLLFGVYGHRVYHHGAGFRSVPTRVDLHRQADNRPSSDRPSLGTLRRAVTADPSKLLHVRARHAGVVAGALRRTVALRREATRAVGVDRMADDMFARLTADPEFFRQLDDSEP
ncbi:MAG TPA: hypothetical protein VN799_11190 [Acidimicrobiales bacterium]|nr:hypothetical protein [Acidimicrobiales bacterium]